MNALEIVLLVAGIICIVVSFIMSPGKDKVPPADDADTTLDEKQKEHIRNQIDEVVAQQMENVSEQTEAHLDKISATKVMELNEYADTVLEEMNRNHNETMFLYDMLNEKSKEIKSTVRTINVTKQQVEKLCEETAKASMEMTEMTEETDSATAKKPAAAPATAKKATATGAAAKKTASASATAKKTASAAKVTTKKTAKTSKTEEDSQTEAVLDTQETGSGDEAAKPAPKKRGRKKKSEIEAEAQQASEPETTEATAEKKTQTKSQPTAEEPDDTALDMVPADIQDTFEDINAASAISRTQRILSMHKQGMEAKVIAKELGIGVGEVTLIIGLYK